MGLFCTLFLLGLVNDADKNNIFYSHYGFLLQSLLGYVCAGGFMLRIFFNLCHGFRSWIWIVGWC